MGFVAGLLDGKQTYDAYKNVGFTDKFTNIRREELQKVPFAKILTKSPFVTFGQALSYLWNLPKLSPFTKDTKLGQLPEGGLRLGGTFVVSGNNVVYQWSD